MQFDCQVAWRVLVGSSPVPAQPEVSSTWKWQSQGCSADAMVALVSLVVAVGL